MATYSEAEAYCESIAFARKSISEAVASTRAQQRAERMEFDYRTGGDSTARLAVQELTPIAVVRCCYLGQTFLVYQPETWLKVIDKSFLLFRQRFGDVAYETIRHRFLFGWNTARITAQENISRQTLQVRRRDYLATLVLLAAQEGLVFIDAKKGIARFDAKQKCPGLPPGLKFCFYNFISEHRELICADCQLLAQLMVYTDTGCNI